MIAYLCSAGMQLIQNTPDLSAYLVADEAIDHERPVVRET
ncbi:MAG: transglutaminase, partial [Streptomyces sp.]|nr:transglutaminase [Streptomyces sp.]